MHNYLKRIVELLVSTILALRESGLQMAILKSYMTIVTACISLVGTLCSLSMTVQKMDTAIERLGKNNPFPERLRNQGALILIFLHGQGDHIEGHFKFFHRMHLRIFCQESPIKNILVYKIIRDYCDIDITSGFCGASAR